MCNAGLFEWSIKNQDTSKPQDPSKVRQISEQDKKWFAEAMEAHTEDVYKRLRGIKDALESKADDPEDVDEKLRLLDDLTEIVENIDFARGECLVKLRYKLRILFGSLHISLPAHGKRSECPANSPRSCAELGGSTACQSSTDDSNSSTGQCSLHPGAPDMLIKGGRLML